MDGGSHALLLDNGIYLFNFVFRKSAKIPHSQQMLFISLLAWIFKKLFDSHIVGCFAYLPSRKAGVNQMHLINTMYQQPGLTLYDSQAGKDGQILPPTV